MLTRKQINQNFIEVCENERTKRGWSQQEMADRLDISLSGYKKIVSGETTRIDLYIAHRLHSLTGRLIGDLIGDSSQIVDIAANLHELSQSQLNFISNIVQFERGYAPASRSDSMDLSVLVLTGDMRDGMIYDSADLIKVPLPVEYFRKYGRDLTCGIKVTSNHLHPVYHSGDILLVSCNPIRDGDTGIFINRGDGRAYLRKFHQGACCILEPLNGFGQTFRVNALDPEDMNRWIKFGYVLTKMR